MSKIGLFGGAFDPPHLGHQAVTKALLDQKLVDEVWYVPVFQHPWANQLGKTHLTDYQQRVEMLELITQPGSKVAHFRDVSFTYPTLTYFSEKYPQHTFFWVMGSEYLPKFNLFLEGHPKLIDFPFYIYPRTNFPMKPLYSNMMPIAGVDEIAISSTLVRETVNSHQAVEHLVDPQVKDYLDSHQLYL